jgi:hypothetical protein
MRVCELRGEVGPSACIQDGAAHPFLLPGTADSSAWAQHTLPQWVDELLGSDVLAIPRVGENGEVDLWLPRETPR